MRTALITGASRGIGAAIADALAPTHTLLLAGRPSPALQATADRLGATTLPLDVTDTDAIPAATSAIAELDVLVHNAGVSIPGRVAESTVDQWRTTFDVNVVGAVAVTLALLPALRRAEGQVVFINSGSGRKASENMASYSASKFALRGMTECWRAELRPHNVRVFLVNPSEVITDFAASAGLPQQDNPTKLHGEDIAHIVKAVLEMDDRGFTPELSVFATNPKD